MTHLSFGFLCGKILNQTKKEGFSVILFEKYLKPVVNQIIVSINFKIDLRYGAIRGGTL